jgi:succinylarginine dihydrolase
MKWRSLTCGKHAQRRRPGLSAAAGGAQRGERQAVNAHSLMNDERYQQLTAWVEKHYRDRLHARDLADPQLLREVYQALDELTQILRLGAVYDFQR